MDGGRDRGGRGLDANVNPVCLMLDGHEHAILCRVGRVGSVDVMCSGLLLFYCEVQDLRLLRPLATLSMRLRQSLAAM